MTLNRRQCLAHLAGSAALVAMSSPLRAQTDTPITIVVPYAPGGTTDMLGRLLAREMAPLLGRRIIVENKPGAGSALGASFVARAAADGNTLLVATSSTLAINPWLYKKLAYDPLKDFAPIGMIGAVPLCVVVNAAQPIHTVAELIAASKAKSGGLNYGSAGAGSPQHLVVELFKVATGAQLTHVPYKGSGLAVTDLLGGQIDLMFSDIPPALPHIRSGRLRALAVTSAQRQPTLADIPTVAESGAAGTASFKGTAWQSLVAPAATPADLLARYADALNKVMGQAELRARLSGEGFEPETMTSRQLASYMRSEFDRWGKVITASGATVD